MARSLAFPRAALLLLCLTHSMPSAAFDEVSPPAPPRALRRVALVTGGTRGIGRGISERLAETGDYAGLVLTYNTDREAALATREEYLRRYPALRRIELVSGDLSKESTRDDIFRALDDGFPAESSEGEEEEEEKEEGGGERSETDGGWALATVVHNAGQYVGITADNSEGIEARQLQFGDGSLLESKEEEEGGGRRVGKKVNLDTMRYYQRLYGDAWVDICERSLDRMRQSADENGRFRGCLVGISSPGCNLLMRPGGDYSMPGSGKSLMEYSMRIFALNAASMGVN